jgi:hypothetical protein
MRRAALCLTLVVACVAVARPAGIFPARLSGNDFVAQVSGQPGVDKWHQNLNAAYAQRFAEGYQAGVVDATEGRLWCAPVGMKPGEVDDRIWAELRGRSGSMPGSAAGELVRLYATRFPCAGGK